MHAMSSDRLGYAREGAATLAETRNHTDVCLPAGGGAAARGGGGGGGGGALFRGGAAARGQRAAAAGAGGGPARRERAAEARAGGARRPGAGAAAAGGAGAAARGEPPHAGATRWSPASSSCIMPLHHASCLVHRASCLMPPSCHPAGGGAPAARGGGARGAERNHGHALGVAAGTAPGATRPLPHASCLMWRSLHHASCIMHHASCIGALSSCLFVVHHRRARRSATSSWRPRAPSRPP
jgi:hypothetical protein